MTGHDHRNFVPGCFRCDLSREETSSFAVFIRPQRGGDRSPAGACPVCNTQLPDLPPSQRRRYCSIRCAGVAKRGAPLGARRP